METQEDSDISDQDMARSSFGNHNKRPLTSPTPNERTNKTPRNGPSPKKPDMNMDKFKELHAATDTLTASLTSDNLMEKIRERFMSCQYTSCTCVTQSQHKPFLCVGKLVHRVNKCCRF